MSIGLLLVRLVVGMTLAAHGTQKLFGWFGGPGLDGAARFMESVGFVPGLSLAFTGPGPISVDGLVGLDLKGPWWGLAAATAGGLGSAVQIATRRRPVHG